MKKAMILFVLAGFIFCCVGCSASHESESIDLSGAYEIKTVIGQSAGNSSEIRYPQLESKSMNIDRINTTIKDALFSYLEKNVADYDQTAVVELTYSMPSCNDVLLCILFQGTVNYQSAAHPINIAFSVCVSVSDGTLITPTELLQTDAAFFAAFRKQLTQNADPERYTATQWEQIAAYIGDYKDEDIEKLLREDPQGTLAIAEEGVIVLFPVPRAIGDYVEILVPFTGTGSRLQ